MLTNKQWEKRLVRDFREGYGIAALADKYCHRIESGGYMTRIECVEEIIRDEMNR